MSYQIKSILYASDLTPGSPAVFRHAVGLAEQFGAELHAVTISPPMPALPFTEFITPDKLDEIKITGTEGRANDLKQHLDKFAEDHPEYDVKKVLASVKAYEGDARKEILVAAKNVLADMIVMGSRGHSPLGEMFIGSVASRVTMKANIPVVLVPIER